MSYPSDPSNPFAPPGHQPPPPPNPYPHDPQAWAPVQQTGYAASAPQPIQHQGFAPAPKRGTGLAIAAIVMSGVALLGVLAMGGFFLAMSSGGGGGALTGSVHPLSGSVSAVVLQDALTSTLEDAGSSVDRVECPADSKVGQGLVTVCHGSVDGFDWTGVVVFEDDGGSFIVTEY